MSEFIDQPLDSDTKDENNGETIESPESKEYKIESEITDEVTDEILKMAKLVETAKRNDQKEINAAEILNNARDVLAELNPRVVAMEDTARQLQQLRKLLPSQKDDAAEDINIKRFSDDAGLFYLKLSNLNLMLHLVRMNETPAGIKEQADQIRKEVDLLGSRIKIASNVREIIHQEAIQVVLACREILGENK